MNPPPPPPHGEQPKGSGLPPGKYDIFIIPPHSSGSGFLYLPSLKPNVNSFAAGFASALILVVIGSALAPAAQAWWNSVKGSGGVGMLMLIVAIGVGAWALGRIQSDGGPGPGGGAQNYSAGPPPNGHADGHTNSQSNGYANGSAPGAGPQPSTSGGGSTAGPKPSWQRANPPPPGATGASSNANSGARGAWERAREETKRKEEERKKAETERKRKEDLEKRLKEAREKEAREREAREMKQKEDEAKRKEDEAREKKRKEDEVKKRREDEAKKRREDEAKKRREEEAKKRKEEEAKRKEDEAKRKEDEAKRKEDEAKRKLEADSQPRGSTYAYSAVGEKTNPWPRGRPPSPATTRSTQPSPTKRPPPAPSATTYVGTEEESYSYRPYDKLKPTHKKAPSSIFSESSYAASHTTSQTTPPPSHRGPYSTKDPDKIVIKAVYAFNNAFLKTPTSQLVSGVGSVTDGLILRITTEGLFIDDDVRGVPQREWDVKAWTMKLVEVWCPSFRQGPAGHSASARVASNGSPLKGGGRRLWGLDKEKPASPEETDALLVDMLQLCKNDCRLRAASSASSSYSSSSASTRASVVSDSAYGSSVGSSSPSRDNVRTDKHGVSFQTGELKTARLHVLRASIRDQEGKKYVFVITEEESWKVAVGLQRLRKGTQVRALGVSGMSAGDARSTLENLGWG
jgi:hypothetical protein